MGLAVPRLQLYGLAVLLQRLLIFPRFAVDDADVVIGRGVVRAYLQRTLVMLQTLGEIAWKQQQFGLRNGAMIPNVLYDKI